MDLNQIKQLREETGASIADCNTCLEEASGNFDKAKELLRKRGIEIANKKSERVAAEGTIASYVHSNGKFASLVALKCETDFVARNEKFRQLAKDIAMQVVAMNPSYLSPSNVPEEVTEKEKEIEREKLKNQGKSDAVIEQILKGKLEKFYSQTTLVKQPFVKDDKRTIEDVIREHVQKLGENIEISQFVRIVL